MNSEYTHPTGDELLCHLSSVPGAVGAFVRAYPGSSLDADGAWLNAWFHQRITEHFGGLIGEAETVQVPSMSQVATGKCSVAPPVRINSLHPRYFRGFRAPEHPINMSGEMIVMEGRNSSGKTSLAEALEWLFTGCLSRRENQESGHPRELQDCVGNEFRPEGEDTWVEASFSVGLAGQTQTVVLRRVLKEDYGATRTSGCCSVLLKDGVQLGQQAEWAALEDLFGSVPPLLMQHTLRSFVESDPSRRRAYFERLLRLDELTYLISKSVVGDAKLPDFPSPNGSAALKRWEALGPLVAKESSKRLHRQVGKKDSPRLHDQVESALLTIARTEFSDQLDPKITLPDAAQLLSSQQAATLQKSFPLLARLQPKRQLADDVHVLPFNQEMADTCSNFSACWDSMETARQQAQSIGDAQKAIAQALQTLIDAKLIQVEEPSQICPLCAYEVMPTLSHERVVEAQGWIPLQSLEATTRKAVLQGVELLRTVVAKALHQHDELLPLLPSEEEWAAALTTASEDVQQAAQLLRNVRIQAAAVINEADSLARQLLREPLVVSETKPECERLIAQCIAVVTDLSKIEDSARRYKAAFDQLQAAVGAAARVDVQYRLREEWLACFATMVAIAEDMQWELSKRAAQKDLEAIREALMGYRQEFVDSRRVSFNDGMQTVWKALRADRYSSFSKLYIPPPRGKGFPVEIEVKAVLDDGQEQREVDALRVFSESQVNALGIAAFITRSELLGHNVLIFDDPVQSMDEEHFKTFARDVLGYILGKGLQVIILTHNDTFARDVSLCHFDRPGYVTFSIRHSRRKGSVVDEGNRRVPERLKMAEKTAEEGKLKDSWLYLRLAIERLYTVAHTKYGPPGFNPSIWQHQTAEYMWDNGAGSTVTARVLDSERKLKEILDMTAAGGHDKPPRGLTDVFDSAKYLRSVLTALQVGG